jgi:hypothetical protein
MTDEIERGNAVVIAGNGFTIDDARARAQAAQRLSGKRRVRSLLVVLDFVQPLAAGWQFVGFGWEAGGYAATCAHS